MDLGRPAVMYPAALLVIAVVFFRHVRGEARHSAESRTMFLRRSILLFVAGGIVAFGAWHVLPTNPESPAMLITYFVSWILGGGMMLFSAISFVAALTARADQA